MNFIHRLTIIDTIDISDKFFNQIQTNYQIAKTFDKNLKARPIKRKFNDKHELVNALKRLRNRTINEVKCNQHDKIFSGFTDLYYHITECHPETILQSSSGSNSNPIDDGDDDYKDVINVDKNHI
uniref:Uncharacterized protein LOC113790318 n=1 Tax=Dermatophagoides pteronyssinus TaxID=6956 RepID=A0A6P6XV37_DERPT|nr:uncharacterized protein LOC113790318 [Dermatophagoides pteronyssinus]